MTIAQFLAEEGLAGRSWYTGTRTGKGKRIGAKYPMDKAHAWWNLPEPAKRELEKWRERGYYGGSNAAAVDKTPYFYVQDQAKVSWRDSAQKAGITRYESWTLNALEKYHWWDKPKVWHNFMRVMKSMRG